MSEGLGGCRHIGQPDLLESASGISENKAWLDKGKFSLIGASHPLDTLRTIFCSAGGLYILNETWD